MSTSQLVLDLNLTENAELIQVYGKGQFCTVIENDLLYLLKTTYISRYNAIASFSIDGNCIIYNRDNANCFVDWSNEFFGQSGNIEDLSDDKIKALLTSYLEPDILNLMSFSNFEFSGNFERIFNQFSKENQEKILDGLQKLGVYKNNKFIIPWTQISTMKQIEWSDSKLFSFAKLSIENMHYDICSRTLNGGYNVIAKNGNCCTNRKFEKDLENKCYIIFNTSCLHTIYDKNIMEQLREDLKGSPYHAANKFVKIEENLTKDLNILIEEATNKHLFVDMSNVQYPDIDKLAEKIARCIKSYQKSDNIAEKAELTCSLKNAYTEAYDNLQKSQLSYKKLHTKLNKKELTNDIHNNDNA